MTKFYKAGLILIPLKRRVILRGLSWRRIQPLPSGHIGIMIASNGMDIMEGGSVMVEVNCTICKMLLNAVSHALIAAVLIKVASVYKYVQVFV